MSSWRPRIFGEWSWLRPLKSAAFVYGCLALIAVFFADRLIFVPPPSTYGVDHPALTLIPREGSGNEERKLATFWYPPANEQAPVLIWTHGNAEDLGTLEPILELFASQGVGLLGCDYPGYGLSEGNPSEKACYQTVASAFRYLHEDLEIAKERIVLVGQSVGSGPAVWLAEREPGIRGLILISPFLSAFRVVTQIPILPRDRFPNIRRMPKITCPLLVFHGVNDEVIPFSHGEKLFALHPGPAKAFVPLPETGHNDLWARQFDNVLTGAMDFAFLGKLPDELPPP